jgi:hypothetical protein
MARALEPNANVRMGQWINGPDGKREVDVEVRGTFDNNPYFLLIECKDWKSPVDIEEIDKLDSKGADLQANRVMICSNSGFTKKALRKAGRRRIAAVSLLASGNSLVRVQRFCEWQARALSVDSWSTILYPTDSTKHLLGPDWSIHDLLFTGSPVVNWLHVRSAELLSNLDVSGVIHATYAFRTPTEFRYRGVDIVLRGIRMQLKCSHKWLSQTVQEDVSLGYFDWIRECVVVPNMEYWSIGWI